MIEFPADPGVAKFDALQEDPARWLGMVAALGARYSSAPAVPAGEGTVLVALLGRELVHRSGTARRSATSGVFRCGPRRHRAETLAATPTTNAPSAPW